MINDQGLTTTYSRATRSQPSLTPTTVGDVPCTGQVRESYHSGVPVPDPGEQTRRSKQLLQSLENSPCCGAQSVGIERALDQAALELPRKQGVAVFRREVQPGRRWQNAAPGIP